MEKGCFYIETHDLEVKLISISKKDADTAQLDDRSISLAIVLRSLDKALSYQTCLLLAANNGAIRVVFIVVRPSDVDGFATRRYCGTFKGFPYFQTVIFTLHHG